MSVVQESMTHSEDVMMEPTLHFICRKQISYYFNLKYHILLKLLQGHQKKIQFRYVLLYSHVLVGHNYHQGIIVLKLYSCPSVCLFVLHPMVGYWKPLILILTHRLVQLTTQKPRYFFCIASLTTPHDEDSNCNYIWKKEKPFESQSNGFQ